MEAAIALAPDPGEVDSAGSSETIEEAIETMFDLATLLGDLATLLDKIA